MIRPLMEQLERRLLLYVAQPFPILVGVSPDVGEPEAGSLTPAEVRSYYHIDQIRFGSVVGDGAGQTIAIVDAFDQPNIVEDVDQFNQYFGLQRFKSNVPEDPNAPTLQIVKLTNDTDQDHIWGQETSLDVEWAHAIAPKANILLIEAVNGELGNLMAAAYDAVQYTGVAAVSMSFGNNDDSSIDPGDREVYEGIFSNGGNVTFLAATGDTAKVGQTPQYPSTSEYVVAVGGTTLQVDSGGHWFETGWAGGVEGGDVSMNSGGPVAVYDSFDSPLYPWISETGTSVATPMWAGLIVIADQGRHIVGRGNLTSAIIDNPYEPYPGTLPRLYQLASDFNDIDDTGLSPPPSYAGPGFDLVTGLGTPKADFLIPDLAGVGAISGRVFNDSDGNGVYNGGEPGLQGITMHAVGAAGNFTRQTAADGTYFIVVPYDFSYQYIVSQDISSGLMQIPVNPSPGDGYSVYVPGNVTGKNFSDFPTVFTASTATPDFKVTLDSTPSHLQVFAGDSGTWTQTYEIPLTSLPTDGVNLTFNLTAAGGTVTIDAANGNPVPTGQYGGITVTGGAGNDTLKVTGGSGGVGKLVFLAGAGNDTVDVIGDAALTALTFDGGTGVNQLSIPTGTTTTVGALSLATSVQKTGAGTLTVNGAQNHSAGAEFIVQAGTVNFNSDAGTVSVLRLAIVLNNAAVLNLNWA